MDHHQFYRMNGSSLNHFPASFPPNYGMPQSFQRQAGFGSQIYDSRPVANSTGFSYNQFPHLWNFPPYPSSTVPQISPVLDVNRSKHNNLHENNYNSFSNLQLQENGSTHSDSNNLSGYRNDNVDDNIDGKIDIDGSIDEENIERDIAHIQGKSGLQNPGEFRLFIYLFVNEFIYLLINFYLFIFLFIYLCIIYISVYSFLFIYLFIHASFIYF